MRLKDKVIIVTGGYRGLGLCSTKAFLKEGAKVAVCGRQIANLRALDESLKEYAGQFLWCPCDISVPLQVSNFIKKVVYEFDSIDVLVNNASIYGQKAKIMDYQPQIFEDVLFTNVMGAFNMIQSVLKVMVPQNYGKIINVSSSAVDQNQKVGGAYHVSKLGLEGLSFMVAREYEAHNICTNIINPFGIRRDKSSPFHDTEMEGTDLGPEDIQELFIYLASTESNGVNGRSFSALEWMKKGVCVL